MNNLDRSKKYVVLRTLVGPSRGGTFVTENSNNNTHSAKGELWYEEIGFADTTLEAQKMLTPIRGRDILISMGLNRGLSEDRLKKADRFIEALRELHVQRP